MSLAGAGGQIVSHYEVLGPIGQGAMGRVVKARDRNLGRVVALKFLASRYLDAPEARERFFREARTISSLSHPNIATIYAIEESGGEPFLALEYLSGGSLDERARGRQLPLPELLAYARQLAAGLDHAHRHGVIHRDVKPANVLFSGDGQLKLVDFGLAKWLHGPADALESGCCGTPAYMAPEQMRDGTADHRSDIYSFGVLLYQMAAGRLPYCSEHPAALFREVLETPHPPLGSLRPDLPPEFCVLVEQCLEKESGRRLSSMAEALARLNRLARPPSGTGETTVDAAPAPASPGSGRGLGRAWSRRRWLWLAAAPAAGAAAWFAFPALRWRLGPGGLSGLRLVAVLPFDCPGQAPEVEEFCLGLHVRLASLLVQAERWQNAISVPPPSEISARRIRTVDEARRQLACDLAFTGSVMRSGDGYEIVLSLTDAAARRQLQSRIIRVTYKELPRQDSILLQAALELLRPALAAAPLMAASAAPLRQASPLAYELCLRAEGVLRRFEGGASVDAALALTDQAIALDPGSAAAYALRAEALVRKYRSARRARVLEEAAEAAAKAGALNADLRETMLAKGRVAEASGRYGDAVREFERAVRLAPGDQEAHRLLGVALARAGEPEKAEEAMRRAIAASPAYWPAYSALGWLLYTRGRLEEAAAQYEAVIRLAPGAADGYRHLGAMFTLLGREDEAVKLLEESLAKEPAYQAYVTLGTNRFYRGEFEAALEAYQQALTLQPKAPEAWAYLGEAREQVPAQRARSREAFTRALELSREQLKTNPKDPRLWMEAAFACAKLGRRDEAYAALGRAIAAAPQDPHLLYRAACAEQMLGNRTRALRYLGQAVELGQPWSHVLREPALAALRADPAFSALRRRAPQRRSP